MAMPAAMSRRSLLVDFLAELAYAHGHGLLSGLGGCGEPSKHACKKIATSYLNVEVRSRITYCKLNVEIRNRIIFASSTLR
jgi:hypothetical protein